MTFWMEDGIICWEGGGMECGFFGPCYSVYEGLHFRYICMAVKIVYFVLITANGSNNTSFCYQQGNLF